MLFNVTHKIVFLQRHGMSGHLVHVLWSSICVLQTTAGLGGMWLKQMGAAAMRYDLTIQ